eukprot:Gregarina_sp_Pseudo_9__1887@NODE_2294_length_1055_cov_3_602362_g1721_i1_p1_GENE_NODE_2294_length_1055_cov_3_602362_g1721_i1NODE_2294_length_1055_cov_3_602362_g1721_i1_p1_ORF_typecomplete_len105_score8_92NPR1_interact/PF15699_5/0_004SART1/PF03343_13/0_017_NODE_2294_length_1055_cov_3_602362_g1721_i1685999
MPESYQQVVSQAFRRGIKRRAKEIITGKDLYDKVKGETEEERTEREKANTLPPNFNIADFDDEEDPFKYVERTRTKDHVQMKEATLFFSPSEDAIPHHRNLDLP